MKFYKRTIFISFIIISVFLWCKNSYSLHLHGDSGLQQIIENGGADCLYIGSSMFRQGLDIYVLEQDEPNSFVLSYNGNQPFAEYLELKYLLENHCEIKRIVLDMYVYSLNTEPWINDTKILYDSDLKFKQELQQEISKSPDYSFSTLWEMFVTANNELFLLNPVYSLLAGDRYYKGGNTQPREGSTTEELEHKPMLHLGAENINEQQITAVRELIQLCDEHNIELCFLETPKYRTVLEAEEYTRIMYPYIQEVTECGAACLVCDKIYEGYLRENNEPNDKIFVYDFDYDNPEYYSDLVHLSSKGRSAFTEKILQP